MRVTTGQLRLIVADPVHFVASHRAGPSPQGFGNPQRLWMQAAWKAYFAADRSPEALWREFESRTAAGARSRQRAALIPGARHMLDTFVEWDQQESVGPADYPMQRRDVPWGRHVLALQRDLVYLTATGYRVRQLWTDQGSKVQHPDAALMVAGLLVCADADLGPGRTEAVEVWQLRHRRQRAWRRDKLAAEIERLGALLDEVEANLLESA